MRESEAIKKYGKRTWKKMEKHMDGITVSLNDDGTTDIPDRDCERAYQLVKQGYTGLLWD